MISNRITNEIRKDDLIKMKTKTKVLFILIVALFAIILLGTTKVEAYPTATSYGVITSGTITDNNIPDTFNVDIKEVEFEKACDEVLNQLVANLKEQGIIVDKFDYKKDQYGYFDTYGEYIEQNANGRDYIQVSASYLNTNKVNIEISNGILKQINVVYNNSNQYNETDKQKVEQALANLNLPKENNDYIVIHDIEVGKSYTGSSTVEILTKAINDNSISFTGPYGVGGTGPVPFEWSQFISFNVYKNDIYYTNIMVTEKIRDIITIPNNIENTEKAYIDYATPILKEYLTKWNTEWDDDYLRQQFVRLEKNSGDIYTVVTKYGDDNRESEYQIVLKKATSSNTETKPITKEDKTTGIKIEGNVSANVVISSNKVTDQTLLNKVTNVLKNISSKYIVYDITLLENNVKIQPNGNVKVYIPIPSEYNTSKLVVYRITDEGKKVEYKVAVNGDYATFETDHFSTYVLAEKETSAHKLDTTPKTGEDNTIAVVCSVLSIMSLAGIVITKKF